MKCNSKLVYFKKLSNRKRNLKFTVPASFSVEDYLNTYKQKDRLDLENIETCDGRIVAEISCYDDPYMGGTTATMEVIFRCDRCGQTHFPELPIGVQGLNDWITKKIEEQ